MAEGHFVMPNGEKLELPEVSFSDIVAFERQFKPLTFNRFNAMEREDQATECHLFIAWCGLLRIGANVPTDFDEFVKAVDWEPATNGQPGKARRAPKKRTDSVPTP